MVDVEVGGVESSHRDGKFEVEVEVGASGARL